MGMIEILIFCVLAGLFDVAMTKYTDARKKKDREAKRPFSKGVDT